MHSHFLPSADTDGGEFGGYARLMTVIEEQKAKPTKRHDDRIIRKSFKDRLNNPDEDRTRTDDIQSNQDNEGTKPDNLLHL